jgi:hypothetical protein
MQMSGDFGAMCILQLAMQVFGVEAQLAPKHVPFPRARRDFYLHRWQLHLAVS